MSPVKIASGLVRQDQSRVIGRCPSERIGKIRGLLVVLIPVTGQRLGVRRLVAERGGFEQASAGNGTTVEMTILLPKREGDDKRQNKGTSR